MLVSDKTNPRTQLRGCRCFTQNNLARARASLFLSLSRRVLSESVISRAVPNFFCTYVAHTCIQSCPHIQRTAKTILL